MREGIPAGFLLWDPAGCLVSRSRPLLRGGKGGQLEAQYGRLLNFLEGAIGWKEARNPGLSKTAGHPTVWLHRAASVGRRRWGSPSCVFRIRVCQYILLLIPRGALGKPVDKTKCQTLDVVSFSISLSDCFNCSVVVLMDLRPWSGSCLSDFQLLFVNNLKRKKKETLHFGDKPVWVTLGVLYSFLPFLLENNVKWFHNVKRKKIATMTKRTVCSAATTGFNQLKVVIQP